MVADDSSKKFNTRLNDYNVAPEANAGGPYDRNLEVDALIVGAGFGKPRRHLCHSISCVVPLVPRW
jgi:hypothetical protein